MNADRRLTDFGKELDRPVRVSEKCYDCAGLYDSCPAWPAGKDFDCRNYNRLPDVMPGQHGQRFPPTKPLRPEPRGNRTPFGAPRALSAIIRGECANQHDECIVLSGLPCGYFERAVLGPPDYKYRTPGYDWEHIFAAYARINPKVGGVADVRHCPDCNATLPPRRRYCDVCSRKRQREHNREYDRKRRQIASHTGELTQNQPSEMP